MRLFLLIAYLAGSSFSLAAQSAALPLPSDTIRDEALYRFLLRGQGYFKNAFEEVGKGLGFTLNRQPYCVRIDQQFFSSEWNVQSCHTLSDITMSDHFPVIAQYTLKSSADLAFTK